MPSPRSLQIHTPGSMNSLVTDQTLAGFSLMFWALDQTGGVGRVEEGKGEGEGEREKKRKTIQFQSSTGTKTKKYSFTILLST